MKRTSSLRALVLGAALTSAADSGFARTIEGSLSAGDRTLQGGEWADDHSIEVQAGQPLVIDLRSTDFDPYLLVLKPDGKFLENDDFQESSEHSRIEIPSPEAGTYRVTVTSYEKGESGRYRLEVPDAPRSGGSTARVERGRLESGDGTLNSGELRDEYLFTGRAGETVTIDLRSSDFDPYLILRPPTGEQQDNDDFEGSSSRSRLVTTLSEAGTYRVLVTTYKKGESGAYTLELPALASDGGSPARVQTSRGRLEPGDATLRSGEYKDDFTFEGRAGERVIIDLKSDDFDPYLILRPPSGDQLDNDDHEGSASWSQIAHTLPVDGTYTVNVTTYKKGSSGAYEYTLTRRGGASTGPSRRSEVGRLTSGDTELVGGEYADKFPLTVAPGTRIVLDLTSDDFDPYVALRSPSGESVSNDDFEGSSSRSRIEHVAEESGEYTIYVTSYAKGKTGQYRLEVETGDAPAETNARDRDLVVLRLGDRRSGELESTDRRLDGRGFADLYAFEGSVGDSVSIDLTGTDLDTYLLVTTPSGRQIENDDFEGSVRRSRIDIPIEEAGRYRVQVTTYDAGETGAYTLSLGRTVTAVRSNVAAGEGGRIFGIFVGISQYGGRANDLAYTDRDAVRVRDAMVRGAGLLPENAVLLQNSEATRTAFEGALRRVANQATPADTLVIFYSGHGGRVPRPTGFDRADPDGQDETLEFYDRELLDDELEGLLDRVKAGRQIMVFDSCFSGGFAKDIITAPGRMGLFSSEEDVTSSVAAKFRAGGYLSIFFSDSLTERYADEDEDGALSALELSHYIAECYRSQVKSTGDVVHTTTNLGYQKLVVDRGSIAPYDVVFRRSR